MTDSLDRGGDGHMDDPARDAELCETWLKLEIDLFRLP